MRDSLGAVVPDFPKIRVNPIYKVLATLAVLSMIGL